MRSGKKVTSKVKRGKEQDKVSQTGHRIGQSRSNEVYNGTRYVKGGIEWDTVGQTR